MDNATLLFTSLSALQNGATPLFMASQDGHVSIVDILLRNGADPNLAQTVSMEVSASDTHPHTCIDSGNRIPESILTTFWVNCCALEKQLASNTQLEPSKPGTNWA